MKKLDSKELAVETKNSKLFEAIDSNGLPFLCFCSEDTFVLGQMVKVSSFQEPTKAFPHGIHVHFRGLSDAYSGTNVKIIRDAGREYSFNKRSDGVLGQILPQQLSDLGVFQIDLDMIGVKAKRRFPLVDTLFLYPSISDSSEE